MGLILSEKVDHSLAEANAADALERGRRKMVREMDDKTLHHFIALCEEECYRRLSIRGITDEPSPK